MRYAFSCKNIQCNNRNKEVIINLPIDDAGKPQKCEECKENLQKIYGNTVIPSGDEKTKY